MTATAASQGQALMVPLSCPKPTHATAGEGRTTGRAQDKSDGVSAQIAWR
ncbi:hypothetical protein PMO31116_02917 [Pandoraea morbifera]|uniref:Uncharacterized protein n=1 Tax=Pandoraea morbifera TaxID=2508300 RepID=A0A5E4VYR6_9BURK|nr:hypothetical protein PMO31116_02917 [Pandoraea morbifera]